MTVAVMTRSVLVLAIFAALLGAGARAAETVVTPNAETRLLAEHDGVAPGGTVFLVLDQTLREGWHVYWKNPGDSGLPLALNWILPAGFVAGETLYPAPERIPVGPFANYGFHGRPAFLIPLTAPENAKPGSTVEIGLKATWLICEEICVPEEGAFSLSLPVAADPPLDPEGGVRARLARSALPKKIDGAGRYAINNETLIFEIAAPGGPDADAYFFPDTDGILEPSETQRVSATGERLRIEVPRGRSAEAAGEISGVLALGANDARQSYYARFKRDETLKTAASGDGRASAGTNAAAPTPGDGAAPNAAGGAGAGFLILALSALAGGLLLNIMPCVFPVIFIKAAALLQQSGAKRAEIRRDGLAYVAGVVAAFAGLGGVLILLRAGGAEIGWGFHLQSPAVVLLSGYILFVVGLNLAGVFHVGSSLQGAGSGLAAQGGALGSFFTGLLAVVVAAPCVGPLLTLPIGAAATLPAAPALAIFVAMGFGLALPFLVLAFNPGLGRFLPKPGAWMETARQALAFPVFAGAAYFIWVLTVQTGNAGLARALSGAILLAGAAWAFERSKQSGRGVILKVASLAAVAAALLQAAPLRTISAATAATDGAFKHAALTAEAYSPERLADLRAAGKPVFVDFTAAWCVTCQFNKLTVFSDQRLAGAFDRAGVSVLVADWTARDPIIANALAGFGANGVPLYAFYPPGAEARIAPQPLTVAAVEKLIAAKGK